MGEDDELTGTSGFEDLTEEQQRFAKLEYLRMGLVLNIVSTAAGMILFSFVYSHFESFNKPLVGVLLMILGLAFIAVPVLYKFSQVKSIVAMFDMQEYEVITTYKDGHKESDHGLGSQMNNFFISAILTIILFALAIVIQPIREIVMIIKYAVLSASEKPPFFRSALFYAVLLAAGFVGSLLIIGTAKAVRAAQSNAEKLEYIDPATGKEQDTPQQTQIQSTQSAVAGTTDKQSASTTSNSAIKKANQTATDSINATAYRGRSNEKFQFLITGTSSGRVWGSGPYTDDSNIAKAAVHAGKIRDGETGSVTIRIMPGQNSYQGSNANGVETEGYGSYDGSYVFE